MESATKALNKKYDQTGPKIQGAKLTFCFLFLLKDLVPLIKTFRMKMSRALQSLFFWDTCQKCH